MHTRKQERDLLKRKLEAGISIHMPAPRRIGKTWTLNRLASDLRYAGWQAVQVDVQGISTPRGFCRELCKRIETQVSTKDKLRNQVAYRLSRFLSGDGDGDLYGMLTQVDPVEFLESLISSLDEDQTKSAILVDEIAYFFLACAENNQREAKEFAYKLRAIQQQYQSVRWVLTGSIGLQVVAGRYGLEGAFVDFETFVLEPFTTEQALSYMRDESIRNQFNYIFDADEAVYLEMFSELGWLAPFYLKLIANEVRPSGGPEGSNAPLATSEDFGDALDRLLQPNRKSEFAVWTEHVDKNLPAKDSEIALHLLSKISESTNGEQLDTLVAYMNSIIPNASQRTVRDILNILLNDGLLKYSESRYSFLSGLIRRYWREYEAG